MAGPPSSALDFSVDWSFRVVGHQHRALARSVHVHLLLSEGGLLRTITRVIAQTISARSPGLPHLPHYLPICKGPVLAAISADQFRPRLICLSSSPTLHLF